MARKSAENPDAPNPSASVTEIEVSPVEGAAAEEFPPGVDPGYTTLNSGDVARAFGLPQEEVFAFRLYRDKLVCVTIAGQKRILANSLTKERAA